MSTTLSACKMTSTQKIQIHTQTPKKKSWAIMALEADEEERFELEEIEREKNRKIVQERLYLYSIGKYHLEEGEILE